MVSTHWLSIRCPECHYDEAIFILNSPPTIVTFRCASCSHTWAVAIASLPPKVLKVLSAIKRAS
jgi:ribosomal protein S27E